MSDHVAIMHKSWGLIPKISDGRKKIESRWSINKVAPWGRIRKGDRVFFKNSGEKVTAYATVSKVLQFEALNLAKVKRILRKYGGDGGIGVNDIEGTISWAKGKKYCTLIFLTHAKETRPFNINKKGFGVGAAWLVVGNISKIMV